MKRIFEKIIKFLNKGKYTTNEDAAAIIRNLAKNSFAYPLEWDDFETRNEDNPQANIALELCFFYAKKYPGKKTALECNEKAIPYFLKTADALEERRFKGLDSASIIDSLRKNILPENIRWMFDSCNK